MGLLSVISKIYDIDTLDTRFTNSSQIPYQTVIDARSDPATSRDAPAKTSTPVRWHTAEFYIYYVCIAIAMLSMFWFPYQVSQRRSDAPGAESGGADMLCS